MSATRREEILNYSQIPVKFQQRAYTDIFCTICSSIFAIVMFIISIACLNLDNLRKMTYPNDIEGNLCGWDAREYKMLYYTTVSDPRKRLCVSSCPKAGDTSLNCYATNSLSCDINSNPDYQVNIYDTEMVKNKLGIFCMPVDEQQRAKVEEMTGLYNKKRFLSTYDAIWNCLYLGIPFGIIYLIIAQYFPEKVFSWSYIIGGIAFLIGGLLVMIAAEGSILLKIIAGIVLIITGILILRHLIVQQTRKQIEIGAKVFGCATDAARWSIVPYLVAFIIMFIGLILLIGFQLLAIWSSGKLVFVEDNPFYEVKSFFSATFAAFSFFEFIWGMSFLKESFNFMISGYAVEWYNKGGNKEQASTTISLKRYLCKHWGSVVGGSLLLQLFYILDLIIDCFYPSEISQSDLRRKKREQNKSSIRRSSASSSSSEDEKKIQKSKFSGQAEKDPRHCGNCLGFLNLVRSESMAYINLASIPYCNASRYCEMLANQSKFYDRCQTTNRLFRISAHGILIAITCAISFLISKQHEGNNTIQGVVFCMMISLFMVTYFISFHADLAEGILVSVFVEEKLLGDEDFALKSLEKAPERVNEVYKHDINREQADEEKIVQLNELLF